MIDRHLAHLWCQMKIHRITILTHVCLHQIGCLCYCYYAKTSSSAVQKRHSKVYGKSIAPSFYSISPWVIHELIIQDVLRYNFFKTKTDILAKNCKREEGGWGRKYIYKLSQESQRSQLQGLRGLLVSKGGALEIIISLSLIHI